MLPQSQRAVRDQAHRQGNAAQQRGAGVSEARRGKSADSPESATLLRRSSTRTESACPAIWTLCREVLAKYRETLADDRRVLFDRFRLVDVAVKVVGIGSVGTMCMVALMMSIAGHPFFLQVKEANASVLEPYAGESAYAHHGQRVVLGQRLMQPASDLFLGWVTGPNGRHFYMRQLRDVKLSVLVETYDAEMLSIYAEACGWVLARAHAKAGDPWTISGYLGKQRRFRRSDGQVCTCLCGPGRARPCGTEGRRARRHHRRAAGPLRLWRRR